MHTGKVIKEILYEINMSRTSFAKSLNVSKSYLLAVINQQKPCSENLFNKIMQCASIPDKSRSRLMDEFFSNKYGADSYKNLKYLISEINNLDRDTKKAYPVRYNVVSTLVSENNPLIVNNCDELIEIIHWFLLKNINSEDFCFYTNYAFDQTDLNDFLFYFFNENGTKNNFGKDFIHVNQINQFTDKKVIHTIFETVRFASIGLNTYYINSDMSLDFLLFPYYIIMNNCVIIFNYDCRQNIVYTDSSVVDYYKEVFFYEKNSLKPIVSTYKDGLDMMTKLDANPKIMDICYSFAGMFCGESLTRDVINEIAAKDLPNRDMLIKQLIHHYTFPSLKIFYTIDALKNFADTGEINYADKYAIPCPPQIRKTVLQNLLTDTAENGNQRNFLLLNNNLINIPDNMDITLYDSTLVIGGCYKYDSEVDSSSESGLPLYFSFSYDSLSLVNTFLNLFDFFEKAGYVYGDSHKKRMIDDLILKISPQVTPPRKICRAADN